MRHTGHSELKKLEGQLKAAHHDTLMSLHGSVGLLKSSASEAMSFIEAGNMAQAAETIATLYYDCDSVQKRISTIAERAT